MSVQSTTERETLSLPPLDPIDAVDPQPAQGIEPRLAAALGRWSPVDYPRLQPRETVLNKPLRAARSNAVPASVVTFVNDLFQGQLNTELVDPLALPVIDTLLSNQRLDSSLRYLWLLDAEPGTEQTVATYDLLVTDQNVERYRRVHLYLVDGLIVDLVLTLDDSKENAPIPKE